MIARGLDGASFVAREPERPSITFETPSANWGKIVGVVLFDSPPVADTIRGGLMDGDTVEGILRHLNGLLECESVETRLREYF